LEEVGLGSLVLDLHGADISRRVVMRQIGESLSLIQEAPQVDASETHRRLVDRRERLNRYDGELHTPRQLSGMSVYEMQGRLLRIPSAATVSTRWRGAAL